MKRPASIARLFLVAFSLVFMSFSAQAQQALVDSILEAEKTYPELAIKGSQFQKAYELEVAAARASDDPVLHTSQWPLAIAKRVAASKPIALAASPTGK